MKPSYKILILVLLLNTVLFSVCTNIGTKAQEPYSIGVQEDKEYIWEVTYLDSDVFGRVLGYDPNFAVGDKVRIVVREVVDVETFWRVSYYFWDYKIDWTEEGVSESIRVDKLPSNYEELIFLPIPIEDYLESVAEAFPADYQVEGSTISQVLKSEIDKEYIHEKSYNDEGILAKEAVYEYTTDRLIVQVEASFLFIPFGLYFIGFIILAIVAIIFILITNRKYLIKLL